MRDEIAEIYGLDRIIEICEEYLTIEGKEDRLGAFICRRLGVCDSTLSSMGDTDVARLFLDHS